VRVIVSSYYSLNRMTSVMSFGVWENVVCWFSLAQAADSARLKTCPLGVLLLYMHCSHGVLHLLAGNATCFDNAAFVTGL